jgi:serine/threonine protein kinase
MSETSDRIVNEEREKEKSIKIRSLYNFLSLDISSITDKDLGMFENLNRTQQFKPFIIDKLASIFNSKGRLGKSNTSLQGLYRLYESLKRERLFRRFTSGIINKSLKIDIVYKKFLSEKMKKFLLQNAPACKPHNDNDIYSTFYDLILKAECIDGCDKFEVIKRHITENPSLIGRFCDQKFIGYIKEISCNNDTQCLFRLMDIVDGLSLSVIEQNDFIYKKLESFVKNIDGINDSKSGLKGVFEKWKKKSEELLKQEQVNQFIERHKTYLEKAGYDIDSVRYVDKGGNGKVFKVNKKDGGCCEVIKEMQTINGYNIDLSFYNLSKNNQELFEKSGLVPYHSITDINDGKYLVVMPYIEGGDLNKEHILREDKKPLTDILNQLVYLHMYGISSNDFKKNNVIVDKQGNAKVIDFGLYRDFYNTKSAKPDDFDSKKNGSTNSIPHPLVYKRYIKSGTYLYFSPSQYSGHNRNALSGDVWALGVTIFYLFCDNEQKKYFYNKNNHLGGRSQDEIFKFIDDLGAEGEKFKELLKFILIVDETKRPTMLEVAKKANELGLINGPINFDKMLLPEQRGEIIKNNDIMFLEKTENKLEERIKNIEEYNIKCGTCGKLLEESVDKLKNAKNRFEEIKKKIENSKNTNPYSIAMDNKVFSEIQEYKKTIKKQELRVKEEATQNVNAFIEIYNKELKVGRSVEEYVDDIVKCYKGKHNRTLACHAILAYLIFDKETDSPDRCKSASIFFKELAREEGVKGKFMLLNEIISLADSYSANNENVKKFESDFMAIKTNYALHMAYDEDLSYEKIASALETNVCNFSLMDCEAHILAILLNNNIKVKACDIECLMDKVIEAKGIPPNEFAERIIKVCEKYQRGGEVQKNNIREIKSYYEVELQPSQRTLV